MTYIYITYLTNGIMFSKIRCKPVEPPTSLIRECVPSMSNYELF